MRRSIVVYSILLVFSTSILYASSQQVAVRLNGGRTPFEGRVDVRRDGENSWRYVCGTGAGWNLTVARAVCKHLGYPAVMWEWHNGEFCGEDLSSASFLCDIRCNPLSESLENCSIDWDNNGCQCDQRNTAGVTCYQLNFLGRYKESRDDRIFPSNTLWQIPPNDVTIEGCIKVCRDRQKTIAVLASGDECYCGDDSVDYWRHEEAIPGFPILPDSDVVMYDTVQCFGNHGEAPYIQGCGGNWQLDVYNGK
ncbi:uncharacterized protein [Ptychodera flava]|uniref:uncharacterized protein n=1 Tax=Ptychodera flava TaxID=63121 RepID=UPI003969C228